LEILDAVRDWGHARDFPRYFRPTEVDTLVGDASKAGANLGWQHKTSFDRLVIEMVEADMVAIRNEPVRRTRDG
jgi:GDPmannose 4,6-dehydratase